MRSIGQKHLPTHAPATGWHSQCSPDPGLMPCTTEACCQVTPSREQWTVSSPMHACLQLRWSHSPQTCCGSPPIYQTRNRTTSLIANSRLCYRPHSGPTTRHTHVCPCAAVQTELQQLTMLCYKQCRWHTHGKRATHRMVCMHAASMQPASSPHERHKAASTSDTPYTPTNF